MDLYSIIVIAGMVLAVGLGALLGFGRTLKFVTGGIVGVIISIVFCVMFGGVIAGFAPVATLIEKGNVYFGGFAEILAKLNIATWIFYVVLFILVQIVRILIVKFIAGLFTPKNKDSKTYKARSIVNRALGVLLMGVFYLLVVYSIMAVLALITDVESVGTTLAEMKARNSFFYLMYSHNPIDFGVLFG